MISLKEASKTIVKECMGIKNDEVVLIIVDEKNFNIGNSIFVESKKIATEVYLLQMLERKNHGEELPEYIAEDMKNADVVIAPTTKSLSHTRARVEACSVGTRVASMPGISEEMMSRTLNTDYNKIADLSIRIAKILSQGNVVNLTSPAGTDINFRLGKRKAYADTGLLHNKGDFGNLPAGEAYIAPLEGSTNGEVVFDGAVAGIEKLDKPIKVEVKDSNITNIEGGVAAQKFTGIVYESGDNNCKNLAELGIGTNSKANLNSSLLEVEKVLNTVHIAFGDNASMGGQIEAPIHIDGVIINPTLVIDDNLIIDNGDILV